MPLLPMLGDPNANRSLIQWVGWAGQWPEGRTPTPKPSRKKERERDRDRDRETEQRDRETETERQRDRTERQRDRETETETETETDRHPVLDFPACPRHIAKMYELGAPLTLGLLCDRLGFQFCLDCAFSGTE